MISFNSSRGHVFLIVEGDLSEWEVALKASYKKGEHEVQLDEVTGEFVVRLPSHEVYARRIKERIRQRKERQIAEDLEDEEDEEEIDDESEWSCWEPTSTLTDDSSDKSSSSGEGQESVQEHHNKKQSLDNSNKGEKRKQGQSDGKRRENQSKDEEPQKKKEYRVHCPRCKKSLQKHRTTLRRHYKAIHQEVFAESRDEEIEIVMEKLKPL